jgi:hypothetical protein
MTEYKNNRQKQFKILTFREVGQQEFMDKLLNRSIWIRFQ